MRIIVIMAHQRSGTHFLGSILDTHPDIRYSGELFCGNPPMNDADMWDDLSGWSAAAKVVCLDIKYNQIS